MDSAAQNLASCNPLSFDMREKGQTQWGMFQTEKIRTKRLNNKPTGPCCLTLPVVDLSTVKYMQNAKEEQFIIN